jgi:two-component system OmpR family response regulator/two-component system response regulator RstA
MPESISPQMILLVEDDHELARVVSEYLTENGYDVRVHGRGDTAAERILRDQPDAVVLDVNLPGLDGLSVCRQVRDRYRGAILMLTARSEEVDEVLGIEFGADDYLAKPVRPRALLARLKSHLRRSGGNEAAIGPPLVIGGLVVDPSRRRAELRGIPIDLTSAEFDLLKLLADHAGVPLSRSDIYQSIHGMRYDSQERSIDLRISRLRRKIEEDPARPTRIKSVRGTGYLLSIEP